MTPWPFRSIPTLAYKPDIDFEPIGLVVEVPLVLVARKDFPANHLKAFMSYVKANASKRCAMRAVDKELQEGV